MKQPKTGFYMGVKGLTEEGEIISFENTYGPVRTTIIIGCMVVGATVIGNAIGYGVEKGVRCLKTKIKEHQDKKNIESK